MQKQTSTVNEQMKFPVPEIHGRAVKIQFWTTKTS